MICLLFGAQDLMIKNRLNKMLNERLGTIDDFNCARFNFDNSELEEVMFECTMMPLGSDKKAVVLDNANFLSNEKFKKQTLTKEEEQIIINYLNKPNEDCDLYFIVHSSALDEKNQIVKAIKEKGKIVESLNPNDKEWMAYAYKLFDKYEVNANDKVIEEFVKRTNNDAMRMTSEIKKLSLYGDVITLEILDKLVNKPIDDNIFNLVNYVITNQKKEALELYRDLLIKNEEPVALIALMATQVRFILDVLLLGADGNSQEEIAQILKVHPYRVKMALNNRRYIKINDLKKELENLYLLDYDIKAGKVDRFFGLELLILNFNKHH